MKLELESTDIESIAQRVTDLLKPLMTGDGNHDADSTFDKKELAQYLKVPVSWVDKKVCSKEIPYFSFGKYIRFSKKAIDKWKERKTVSPIPFLKPLNKNT